MKTLRAQGRGVAWDGFCWTQPMELLWWGLGCVILFMVRGALTVLLKGLFRSSWQICKEMKVFLTKFKGWVIDRFAFFFFFAHQCQWDISGCQVCKHLSWAVTTVIFMSSVHFPLLLLLVWPVIVKLEDIWHWHTCLFLFTPCPFLLCGAHQGYEAVWRGQSRTGGKVLESLCPLFLPPWRWEIT